MVNLKITKHSQKARWRWTYYKIILQVWLYQLIHHMLVGQRQNVARKGPPEAR
jgi:hypothetical protein